MRQVKAARELLGWKQADLAEGSGLSIATIGRMETQEGELTGREETVAAIRTALEATGVEFIPENGGGAGVRLRKPAALPGEDLGAADVNKAECDMDVAFMLLGFQIVLGAAAVILVCMSDRTK